MIRSSAQCVSLFLLMSNAVFAGSDELAGFSAYYVGGLFSSDEHYSIEASADLLFSDKHWLGLTAMHSDSQGPFASLPGSRSAAFDIGFGGELKPVQYSLAAAWSNDQGLGDTLRYRAALASEYADWMASLSLEWRDARYQLSNFNALLRGIDELLEAQLQEQLQARFPHINATDLLALQADLDIRSLAYTADLEYSASDVLRIYVAYTYYDYREAPDRVRLSAGLNRFGDTDRGQRVLAQINQALASSVDGLAGDFRRGFYTRSASIGLDLDHANHNWLVELSHDKDAISGQAIHSASVQWITPLADVSDLRIAITSHRAGKLGNSNQIAFGVFFYH